MKEREKPVGAAKPRKTKPKVQVKKPAPVKAKPKREPAKLTPEQEAAIAKEEKEVAEKQVAESDRARALFERAASGKLAEEEGPETACEEAERLDDIDRLRSRARLARLQADQDEREAARMEAGEEDDEDSQGPDESPLTIDRGAGERKPRPQEPTGPEPDKAEAEPSVDDMLREKLSQEGPRFRQAFFGAQLYFVSKIAGVAPQVPDVMQAYPPAEYRYDLRTRMEMLMIWYGQDAQRMASVFGPTSDRSDVWSASYVFQGGAWILRPVNVDDRIALAPGHNTPSREEPPAPTPATGPPAYGGQPMMYVPVMMTPYGYPLPGTAVPHGHTPGPGTAAPPAAGGRVPFDRNFPELSGQERPREQGQRMHELNPSARGGSRTHFDFSA